MASITGHWENDQLVLDKRYSVEEGASTENIKLEPWDIIFIDGDDPLLVITPPTAEFALDAYILADPVHATIVMKE